MEQEKKPPRKICFIGLGVMGFPMAGHLAGNDHQMTVYNRTPAKSEKWVEKYGGKFVQRPADAAHSEVIISCVGNDDDLKALYLGDQGLFTLLKRGSLVIDHTTASAEVAEQLHQEAVALGLDFLDAPVSGGEQGAQNGALTIMCGGSPEAFEAAQPVLGCYARSARLLGGPGNGQRTKMVNQIAICGLIQSLAEAIRFSEKAGLDTRAVIDVISKGAAQSWQMENRHETMLRDEYEHGFAVDLMRKDLGIVLKEASKIACNLPVTALIDQYYAEVQAMGGGQWDTSALLARLNSFEKT